MKNFREEYWEGADAFDEGKDVDCNPYVKDTMKWVAWRAGWIGYC